MIRTITCAAAALAALTGHAHAGPKTLTCTMESWVNWRAGAPELVTDAADAESGLGAPMIHLDPREGRWFLEVPGSAALTNGGGTFAIVRASEFDRYYAEWVGVDHDDMLRIRGDKPPYPFVFVSNEYATVFGTCVEPEKAFILLGKRGPL